MIFDVDGDDNYNYDVGFSDDVGNQSSALSTIHSLTRLMHHTDFSRAFEAEAKAAGDAKSAADAKATSEARAAAESQAAAQVQAAAKTQAMIYMLKQAEQIEQLESACKMLNEVPMLFCTLSSASPSFCSNVAHRPASKLPPPLPPSALPPLSSPRCIRSTLPSWNRNARSWRLQLKRLCR